MISAALHDCSCQPERSFLSNPLPYGAPLYSALVWFPVVCACMLPHKRHNNENSLRIQRLLRLFGRSDSARTCGLNIPKGHPSLVSIAFASFLMCSNSVQLLSDRSLTLFPCTSCDKVGLTVVNKIFPRNDDFHLGGVFVVCMVTLSAPKVKVFRKTNFAPQ